MANQADSHSTILRLHKAFPGGAMTQRPKKLKLTPAIKEMNVYDSLDDALADGDALAAMLFLIVENCSHQAIEFDRDHFGRIVMIIQNVLGRIGDNAKKLSAIRMARVRAADGDLGRTGSAI